MHRRQYDEEFRIQGSVIRPVDGLVVADLMARRSELMGGFDQSDAAARVTTPSTQGPNRPWRQDRR